LFQQLFFIRKIPTFTRLAAAKCTDLSLHVSIYHYGPIGIQPDQLRRESATLSLARRAMGPGHMPHLPLTCSSAGNARPIKSIHPFVPAVCNNSSVHLTTTTALWADHRWNAEWLDNTTRIPIFIPDIGTYSPRMTLPKTAWVRLSRIRTGAERFHSCSHKWCMAPSATCECGAEEQTVDQVVLQYPIHRPASRPDGSGWRNNRMAAQHLPRDLVRPSSGCKELTQTMKTTVLNVNKGFIFK